jgi:hypothetical protein
VLEANASRYHGVPPGEINWTDAQKHKRAVTEHSAGSAEQTQQPQGGKSIRLHARSGTRSY